MIEAARYEAEREEAVTGSGIAFAFVRSVLWAAVATILGTTLGFAIGIPVTGWHGLLYLGGMVLSLAYSWHWIRDEDFEPMHLVFAGALHLLILAVGAVISARTYDVTETGRSDHYEAVYLLRAGWNPLEAGEVGLPVRGVRGIYAGEAIYRSEGHGLSASSILAAVLADFAGGTETGKGYQWVYMAGGAVFLGVGLLQLGVATGFAILAGVAFGIGGPFVATWAGFSPGTDWVLLVPVFLLGLYGSRETASREGLDCVVAALILALFSGTSPAVVYVGLLGLLLQLKGLPFPRRPKYRILDLVWGLLSVGAVVGAFAYGDPEIPLSEGAVAVALGTPEGEGGILDEAGPWTAFTNPALGLPATGSNGTLFPVGMGLALFLFVRRWVVGLWPGRGTLFGLAGLLLGVLLIGEPAARAVFWMALVTLLLMDTLRDPSADELAPGFYRLGAPRFIHLGRGGGTARWMAAMVFGLWIVHGLVVSVVGTIAVNRAQLELKSFLYLPEWRSGIVRVGFGESLAAYEWMQLAQIRFELARDPGAAARPIPWTDLRVFSLPAEDEPQTEGLQ